MKNKFWYTTPRDPMTLDGWEKWQNNKKTEYPIQYFIRDTLPTFFRRYVYLNIVAAYWFIYRVINPCHKDIHKAIPRQWADITSLVVDVNFAMIKSFKKEAEESFVNWDGTAEHRQFKNWLDEAFTWITIKRPALQKQMDESYPPSPLPDNLKDAPYAVLYAKVNELETNINDTDTAVLKKLVDYRNFMWT